jgi:aminocarboxymuconate-semialdehyde decarboxylase
MGATASIVRRCGAVRPAAPGTQVAQLPGRKIDLHCHLHTPAVEQLISDHPKRQAAAASEARAVGAASVDINARKFAALAPKLTQVDERLRDMDAMGVDVQVISPSPLQYHYWAEPDLADQLVRLQNEAVASYCARHPERFIGLGAVALQDPLLAARQLDCLIRKGGFKGVEISTLVNGRDIADRFFDPFWKKADELGAVIFIHPWGTTLDTRLADHYLMNTIGQPFETTVCLSKLIFSGALDRFTRVKILAAHGGGYLPLYVGRSNHAYAVRSDAQGCLCRPADYLKRIWFDSLVYEPEQLARLIDQVGVKQIVLGTDYPFDMGHYDPASLLEDFDERTQRLILEENAATLLDLPYVAASQGDAPASRCQE